MRRILMVADVEGWAFWNMAHGVSHYAPDGVDVSVITADQYGHLTRHLKSLLSWPDAICDMSWVSATFPTINKRLPIRRLTTVMGSHGFEHDYPPPPDATIPQRIATQLRNRQTAEGRLHKFDNVIAVNRSIDHALETLGVNHTLCASGVDDAVFVPDPHSPSDGPLRVGWCGQRKCDTKGFWEVLEPLRSRLGAGYQWKVNGRTASNALPPLQMVAFYQSLDVFVCTSCSEGGPLPPYEAMSCGIPVISTDVGSMRDLIDDRSNGCLVRSFDDETSGRKTAEQIAGILETTSRSQWREMGQAARESIEQRHSWRHRAPEWCAALLGES